MVNVAGLSKMKCMCFFSFLFNRKDVCFDNKNFVDKQRVKGDRSVGYSIYMNVTMNYYEDAYSITELEYSKEVKALAGRPNVTDAYSIESDYMKSLNVPLNHQIGEGKENDFVLYAAIDLMNAMYNKEFPGENVLIFVISY